MGETVEMRCVVTGNPEPRIEWSVRRGSLPGDAFVQDGLLRFQAISRRLEGEYECRATSSVGEASATVTVVIEGLTLQYFYLYLLVTCVVMSGEADALNAHIISPVLVESVLEGVGGRSIHNVLWKSIPVSLAEERPTNPTSISRLRQFETVSCQIVSGICEFKELSRINVFFVSDFYGFR